MISDIARRVLDIIPNPRRWVKGTKVTSDSSQHCVVGALEVLCIEGQQREDFGNAFYSTAQEQYPEFKFPPVPQYLGVKLDGYGRIITVNDEDGIRYRDIRRILEKLAARED